MGETSIDLLHKARGGDREALERVLALYLPRLRRWASGRLPGWARGMVDTDDMIQDTLIRACDRLSEFEPRGEGALQAYLRNALRNRIIDEVRRAKRRPPADSIPGDQRDREPSPLETTIGLEALEAYERALAGLAAAEREAVIARVEMGMEYAEIAAATGKASPDAARMMVSRALLRLAKEMGRGTT